MTVRVLVVDDSGFYRRRLIEFLSADPGIEVVGTASDGREAVDRLRELSPDVVTMDVNMPVMDGIAAVRCIMEEQPTPVFMLSSLTREGAQATFDALDAGAVDFMPKQTEALRDSQSSAARQLRGRIRRLGRSGRPRPARAQVRGQAPAWQGRRSAHRVPRPDLVVIGCSTGGPVALQRILTDLPPDYPAGLLLVQHMPGGFTPSFAERLNASCPMTVREARSGDRLEPGVALLAPGGRQTLVERKGARCEVTVCDAPAHQSYKPSVDVVFNSVAENYEGNVLALVLTGMGADGREGAHSLKAKGATVWAQDRESCVVYGMPMAVARAGLADEVVPLDGIGRRLCEVS